MSDKYHQHGGTDAPSCTTCSDMTPDNQSFPGRTSRTAVMCDYCGVAVEPLQPEKHPKADCPRARAEAVWIIDNDMED